MTPLRADSLPLHAVFRVVGDIQYRPLGTAFACAAGGILYTAAHVGLEIRTCRLLIDRGDRKPKRTGYLGAVEERAIARITTSAEDAHLIEPVAINSRHPIIGEDVFVLGYPCSSERNDWKLSCSVRVCRSVVMAEIGRDDSRRMELQGAFPRGFSGAPVLAALDGALLGMLDMVGYAPISEEKVVAGFHLGVAVPASLLAPPMQSQ